MIRAFTCVFAFILMIIHESSFALDKRNQVEDLMIWKISDELKLSSKDEKKFSEIFKSLNLRKNELNRLMQETISKSGLESEKAMIKNLQDYRNQLLEYNKLSEREFDELKKIFGAAKMLQYLKIKQDLNTRLKSILSQGDGAAKGSSKLPQPKVIEEK